MCHILLLMPLLGLPVFWLMPLNQALPIYIVVVLICGILYRTIWKSMNTYSETGPEGVIGTKAEVVSKLSPGHLAQYVVRTRGELWSALCNDTLQPGETVNVADLKGINLIIEPGNRSISSEQSATTGEVKKQSGIGKRSCH